MMSRSFRRLKILLQRLSSPRKIHSIFPQDDGDEDEDTRADATGGEQGGGEAEGSAEPAITGEDATQMQNLSKKERKVNDFSLI